MVILVTGINLLGRFVGRDGVGLGSFLVIGCWCDKWKGVGWKNSNAARKAMIANRVGDFGLLMAIFLIFWTFGTLDYYRPGEIANVPLVQEEHEAALAAEEAALAAGSGETHGEAAPAEGEAAHSEGEAVAAEGESHGEPAAAEPVFYDNEHIETSRLGVFGQAERMLKAGHEVDFGPFKLPIETVLVLITLFMLVGATGKSAQIPLFVWLPDAMAGPTPVSALIHAATMVTAGVYMMVRANVWYYNAELTSLIVTIIGATTAIMAGYIAMGQWDIKRVLAYSTVSQLGFMVAAVGIGAYGAAMFHLVTHAFFKALLFLGSGSVIHGMEHGHHLAHERSQRGHGHGHDHHDDHGHDAHEAGHEFDPQDMRNMGGLARRMPVTFVTYLIGTLALAGIFPLAGFWSKDEILVDSLLRFTEGGTFAEQLGGLIALGLLLAAAGFTAFYMWRQIEMVFFGQPRTEAADHAPESAPSMVIVLVVLAVLSVLGGAFNLPKNVLGLDSIFGAHQFTHFLEFSVAKAHAAEFNPLLALIALGIAIAAIFLARSIYGQGKAVTADNADPLAQRPGMARIWQLSHARLYWDEIYFTLFENPFNQLSKFLADTLDWRFWHDYFHNAVIGRGFNAIGELLSKPVDLGIIDGVVNGVGVAARWSAERLRRIQTGYVRTYAVTLMLGVVLVIVILLLPLLQR